MVDVVQYPIFKRIFWSFPLFSEQNRKLFQVTRLEAVTYQLISSIPISSEHHSDPCDLSSGVSGIKSKSEICLIWGDQIDGTKAVMSFTSVMSTEISYFYQGILEIPSNLFMNNNPTVGIYTIRLDSFNSSIDLLLNWNQIINFNCMFLPSQNAPGITGALERCVGLLFNQFSLNFVTIWMKYVIQYQFINVLSVFSPLHTTWTSKFDYQLFKWYDTSEQ